MSFAYQSCPFTANLGCLFPDIKKNEPTPFVPRLPSLPSGTYNAFGLCILRLPEQG